MATLVCLGLGYCAQHYVAEFGGRYERIVGTTRTAERARELGAQTFGGREIEMQVFDGNSASSALAAVIRDADALLISAAPNDIGDPVLAALAEEIAHAAVLRSAVVLSTIGVYGDSGGAWIDETAVLSPRRGRGGSVRVEAEAAWQALGAQRGVAVAILRLGGIYGPGQNLMTRLRRGPVPRIAKPGHVSNRIHVFDIAQTIDAAFAQCASGVFNIVDDEPTSPSEVTAFAASLLGMEATPEIPYADAAKVLSPLALSFYDGCIRARNDKLKRVLGVTLRYPNYREGLRSLLESGDRLSVYPDR